MDAKSLSKDGHFRWQVGRSAWSSLLGWSWNVADSLGLGLVELHKLGKIELGLLEDLDFADDDVLKWEDFAACSGDLLANIVGEAKQKYNSLNDKIGIDIQLLEEILKG